MRNLKRHIILTMGLGTLTVVAGLFSLLALTDIYHGEFDTTLEWRIVQISALVTLLFTGSALVALGRALRHFGKPASLQ